MNVSKSEEKRDKQYQDYSRYHEESLKHWRAWGSWFSWGSPVGLGLFYALVIISTGIFIWLIHHK